MNLQILAKIAPAVLVLGVLPATQARAQAAAAEDGDAHGAPQPELVEYDQFVKASRSPTRFLRGRGAARAPRRWAGADTTARRRRR